MIPATDRRMAWRDGAWLNPPADMTAAGNDLIITAAAGSDFWRVTAYGFVHDDGHALLHPFELDSAVEVAFHLDFNGQFDQAGILVRADAEHWVKAGVEYADGVPQVGAVVTHGLSDWSVRPVPAWAGKIIALRISRAGDALTFRARPAGGDWELVRVAPWGPDLVTSAGPFCCAPTRAGLQVHFSSWDTGPADEQLHP